MLKTLRRLLGMTTAPRLVGMLAGPVTFVCGLLTARNLLTEAQAIWVVVTGLPAAVGAVYWLLAQTDEAVAERAATQAPNTTMDKVIEAKPQIAMDKVVNMDGVRDLVADKSYADANPNENIISPAQAAAKYAGGTSP